VAALALKQPDFRLFPTLVSTLWWAYGSSTKFALGEHGWRDEERLARGLCLELGTLRVHLFRARKQLARVGVCDPGALIERRGGAGQIRLGSDRLLLMRDQRTWLLSG